MLKIVMRSKGPLAVRVICKCDNRVWVMVIFVDMFPFVVKLGCWHNNLR